jgi:chromosome segregation ATPase
MTSNELFKIELFVSDILRGVRYNDSDFREAADHLKSLLELVKEKDEEVFHLRKIEEEWEANKEELKDTLSRLEDLEDDVSDLEEKLKSIKEIIDNSEEEYFKISPDIQKIKKELL